jgi:hypothetical protein
MHRPLSSIRASRIAALLLSARPRYIGMLWRAISEFRWGQGILGQRGIKKDTI